MVKRDIYFTGVVFHPIIAEREADVEEQEKNNKPGKTGMDETDYGLTLKEKELLRFMKEAHHLKEIAQLTNSSYETVRTHVKHIYKKLGVMSASEAVIKAMKMDL